MEEFEMFRIYCLACFMNIEQPVINILKDCFKIEITSTRNQKFMSDLPSKIFVRFRTRNTIRLELFFQENPSLV